MNDMRSAVVSMWNANHTTQEIAIALGTTKNAICGMLKRMRDKGVPLEKRPSRPAPEPAKRRVHKRVTKIAELKAVKALRKKPAKPEVPQQLELLPVVPPAPVTPTKTEKLTLLELRPSSCRFIVTDGRNVEPLYCGLPKITGSYCAEHATLCYRRD